MYNDCYRGKVVLVTGHTGFKGSWLSIWLTMMGAKVVGYALDPASDKGNFSACRLHDRLHADVRGDVRDMDSLNAVMERYKPEFVFHLAAQALVRTAYRFPRETYETNLMGSLNVLEAVRSAKKLGISTIALTGADGGQLANKADASLRVPSGHTPRIQEMHILIGHALCGIVEKALCR